MTDYIVDALVAIGGVMEADIQISEDTVTTYVPADQLETVQQLKDIDIEVIGDYEHEYLVSAKEGK
ncbi:MAG: hypothetical protein ABEH88_09075 [Halobacteriales archaeon]